jgi:hypothetical protein
MNGKSVGLDWSNVVTEAGNPGTAYGTESGAGGYTDSTALLTGSWSANQTVEATVRVFTQDQSTNEEVELRLRSSLSAHWCTGYEVNWSVKSGNPYMGIVRWNGPLANFTGLAGVNGIYAKDGDVIKATNIGNTITAYKNGVQIIQATDSTYPSGNPGIGLNLYGSRGSDLSWGLTDFSASAY